MIRNENQLKSAINMLKEVDHEMSRIREKYFDDEMLDIYILPLLEQKYEIEDEINTYEFLRDCSFEDGINFLEETPGIIDNIGELLTKIRIAAKITQSQLAEKLGWSQPNISRFESENYGSQTIKKMIEYTSQLGVWLKVSPSFDESSTSAPSIKKNEALIPSFVTWGDLISKDLYSSDSTGKDWQRISKIEEVV